MAISTATLLERASTSLRALPFEAWHFGDSVAFDALVRSSDLTGDLTGLEFARGFIRGWEATRDGHRELDCTAPGLAFCEIYERTGDEEVLQSAVRLAEYLITRPRVDGVFATWQQSPLRKPYGPVELPADQKELLSRPGPGVFVDCLHFDPPFFAALGRVTEDRKWTNLAIEQAEGYIRLLQDAKTGLFHHFFLERATRAYVLGWGRGQGWALLGLLDVIENVGSHADTSTLRVAVKRLVEAMLQRQNDDGSWFAVTHEPRSGSEASTAPFMVVGFQRAAAAGIVSTGTVCSAVDRALDSMFADLDEEGILHDVSAAVWACTLDEHYFHVPKGLVTPWGQGPTVLALLTAISLNRT